VIGSAVKAKNNKAPSLNYSWTDRRRELSDSALQSCVPRIKCSVLCVVRNYRDAGSRKRTTAYPA
jgi:hypothetical protein